MPVAHRVEFVVTNIGNSRAVRETGEGPPQDGRVASENDSKILMQSLLNADRAFPRRVDSGRGHPRPLSSG